MKIKLMLMAFISYFSAGLTNQITDNLIDPFLILNMENFSEIPRNFRTSSDSLRENEYSPSTIGLKELRISGSSQFSEEGLNTIIKILDVHFPLTIVDLRQESHGFVNGAAVSWFRNNFWDNNDKTVEQIEVEEQNQLNIFLIKQNIFPEKKVKYPQIVKLKIPFQVKTIATEKQLVKSLNLDYVRISITDHNRPSDENVDRFVQFINNLPKETWLHFHCSAGVGRTTTFMTMYDMMHNAKYVSLEDILLRQHYLGGFNFTKLPDDTVWKYPYALARKDFIEKFYLYCRENTDNFMSSWIEYLLSSK
jgi:Inositol hexakisphosphate